MGDVVEVCSVGEFPALIAFFVLWVNCQDGGDLAVSGDDVFARGQREGWLLHDQAVLFEPPVGGVELPA